MKKNQSMFVRALSAFGALALLAAACAPAATATPTSAPVATQPPAATALPEGVIAVEDGATIVFSGSAQGAARAAADELAERWGVAAELWSATSYKRLREDALATERWNRLHPTDEPRDAFVTSQLAASEGPIVAVTDFMKAVPDQIARFINRAAGNKLCSKNP